MASLKHINLKGYRSIREMDLELGPINILIGANGAGKSNFLSFFKMLNEMLAGRLQEHIGTIGRAKSLLHFGPKVTRHLEGRLEFLRQDPSGDSAADVYAMRLSFTANDMLTFAAEELGSRSINQNVAANQISLGAGHMETRLRDPAFADDTLATQLRQQLLQCRMYHFHDTSATANIRLAGWIGNNLQLHVDGDNLAAMLYAYQRSDELVYRRIVGTVRRILPEFDDFVLEPDRLNAREIYLNWKQQGSDYVFGPHQMSDGSLRAIALVTLLLQPQDDLPGVIILDEPELGLHPAALNLLAGLLQSVSHHCQVIVSTQSAPLVDCFAPGDIVVVNRVAGATEFNRLDADVLAEWLQDYTLGQLWEKNVIGGGPFG